MPMAIEGTIPKAVGIWVGIDLLRSSRKLFKKLLFIKQASSGDLTSIFKEKTELKLHGSSFLRTGCYFVVAGIYLARINRQRTKLSLSLQRLRNEWVYYHTALTPLDEVTALPRSDRFILFKRIHLAGKNALLCAVEAFCFLKLLMELWDLTVGTDEERDRLAYAALQDLALQFFEQIDQLRLDGSIQEQLEFLGSITKKLNHSPFFITGKYSFAAELSIFQKRPFIADAYRQIAATFSVKEEMPESTKPGPFIEDTGDLSETPTGDELNFELKECNGEVLIMGY